MSKTQEIKAQIAKLEQQLHETHKQEMATVIADIKAKIKEYQITPQDLGFSAKTAGKAKNASSRVGTKVAPKYRDAATGAVWTGRGVAPKWIAGKDRAAFLIK